MSKDKDIFRLLAESPNTADIKHLLKDPKTGSPIAFTVEYTTTKWYVLDTAFKKDFEHLEETFVGEFNIGSQSLDNTKWVITHSTASGIQYHIYDRGTTSSTFLFHSNDELLQYTLNNMHPVVIKSRDGHDLVSYLTIPDHLEDSERSGRPTQPIPLVLRVHGGPWWRDSFGFSKEHQWFSNRGFAVLSVNFRGSTGFGKTFVELGNRQWSKNMHNDLIGKQSSIGFDGSFLYGSEYSFGLIFCCLFTSSIPDGVEWAITEGIAIREKVAIYGGSYGGYSALVGLSKT